MCAEGSLWPLLNGFTTFSAAYRWLYMHMIHIYKSLVFADTSPTCLFEHAPPVVSARSLSCPDSESSKARVSLWSNCFRKSLSSVKIRQPLGRVLPDLWPNPDPSSTHSTDLSVVMWPWIQLWTPKGIPEVAVEHLCSCCICDPAAHGDRAL